MTKTVKSILFRVNIKGKGIVNYDSSEQKKLYWGTSLTHLKGVNDNVKYAKKRFYGTSDNLKYKITISSDCLKHSIFGEDVAYQSPNLINSPSILYQFIASPMALLRGYLFTDPKETLKRKSPITLCDAEQTCDAYSHVEIASKSGKNSSNTLYNRETVGEIKYSTSGTITLKEMQFISASQIFDRYSLNPDNFIKLYKPNLKKRLPTFDSDLGYYVMDNTCVELPEYGIKLSNDDLQELVNIFFTKLLSMNILRKDAYAETESIEYKLVYDCTKDTFDNDEDWISFSNDNKIKFISKDCYHRQDTVESVKMLASIDADENKRIAENKTKKAEKAAEKKVKDTEKKDSKSKTTKNDE